MFKFSDLSKALEKAWEIISYIAKKNHFLGGALVLAMVANIVVAFVYKFVQEHDIQLALVIGLLVIDVLGVFSLLYIINAERSRDSGRSSKIDELNSRLAESERAGTELKNKMAELGLRNKNFLKLAGEWEYLCTRKDTTRLDKYCHGGTITIEAIQEDLEVKLKLLHGKRLWEGDIYNPHEHDSDPSVIAIQEFLGTKVAIKGKVKYPWEAFWMRIVDDHTVAYFYDVRNVERDSVFVTILGLGVMDIQDNFNVIEGQFWQLPPNGAFFGHSRFVKKS